MSNLYPRVKQSIPEKILVFVLRLFGRSKKNDPEDELKKIENEKQEKKVQIAELLGDAEKLSTHMESVQVAEQEAEGLALKSANQESATTDASIRRAFERTRWQFQDKRRLYERERWGLSESLRRINTKIHSLRLELLRLESREGDIERIIERRALVVGKTQKEKAEKPEKKVSNAVFKITESGVAKKHILFRDLMMLAVRTFRVKPGMTMLTVLGIGVSFSTIFFLVSFGYGLEKVLLDQFASDTLLRSLTVQSPNPEAILLDRAVADRIASLPGVEHVEPIFGLSGQVESGALAAEVQLHGTNPEYFSISGGNLKEGRVYKTGEHAIVLSSNFLQTMNKKTLNEFVKPFAITVYRPHVGEGEAGVEAIRLGDDFRVVGISDDDENPDVFLSPEFISGLVSQYSAVNVLAKDDKVIQGLRTTIADQGFMSSSVVDTVDQATKVFNVAEIILALFGAASLVVATIGMINTMTVSLLERTQEIGIMKVLGVSDGDVRRLFLLEASIIGGLGGISGLIMGIFLSQGFNLIINLLAENLGGSAVSLFYYPTWFIVAIIIASFVIGFLTGLMPSQRAAKMDPLNAVKYK